MRRSLVLSLFLVLLFFGGAWAHARYVNVDPSTHDQSAYIEQARLLSESHFAAVTNRTEMPIFTSIQALFWRSGQSVEDAFWRAKIVSIVLATLAALGTLLTLRRLLPRRTADVLSLIFVFTIFLFRAAYVQTEPLYYLFSFWALLALATQWKTPSWQGAAVAGALVAVAWLAKASILVALILFVLLSLIRQVARIVRGGVRAFEAVRLAQGAAVVAFFFLVAYPYIKTSHDLYGSWFFNIPSKYVFWCDSWEDFCTRCAKIGLPYTWPKQSDRQDVPSFSHYFASHSLFQPVIRELKGVPLVVGNFLLAPCAVFVLSFIGLATALLMANPRLRRQMFPKDLDAKWVFLVPYFALHFLLLGWYGPIGANARFSVSLVIPSVTFLALGMTAATSEKDSFTLFGRVITWNRGVRAIEQVAWIALFSAVPVAMCTLYSGG